MAVREHEHRGEKPNATGGSGDEAQRCHLLQGDARVLGKELARLGVGVCTFDIGRDNDVVAHAEVLVSQRFRLLRNSPQCVGIAGDSSRTEMESEFHWFLNLCLRRSLACGLQGRRQVSDHSGRQQALRPNAPTPRLRPGLYRSRHSWDRDWRSSPIGRRGPLLRELRTRQNPAAILPSAAPPFARAF
jgi:hypothetical protein